MTAGECASALWLDVSPLWALICLLPQPFCTNTKFQALLLATGGSGWGGATPCPPQHCWALLRGGRMALGRGDDEAVSWWPPRGPRTSGRLQGLPHGPLSCPSVEQVRVHLCAGASAVGMGHSPQTAGYAPSVCQAPGPLRLGDKDGQDTVLTSWAATQGTALPGGDAPLHPSSSPREPHALSIPGSLAARRGPCPVLATRMSRGSPGKALIFFSFSF